ncbi:MAG: Uma2 family endonuclease [Planctomycetota bacterium]|nr:Uma2 family endonuclease [Planctomycetota bacterium]
MPTTLVFEDQFEMPLDLRTLEDFRRWALSDDFPQRGRIDFVGDRIEVDMSPEDLFTHGTLKTEILGVLHQHIKQGDLGHLFSDCTRVATRRDAGTTICARRSDRRGTARGEPTGGARAAS